VKAPVFNEIILKLSALGDRQIDRGFYELSPALQALRGGLGSAAGGESSRPFDQGGGESKGDRRGREERRLMASAEAAGGTATGQSSQAMSGAFAASLADGGAGRASRETLVRELRDKLVYSARRGVRRLKMSLTPESLGGLDIELRVKGSQVTANIRADTPEAYAALEGEVRTLREELKAEGLELKLTVSYDGAGGAGDGSGFAGGSYYGSDGRRWELAGGYGQGGRADPSGDGADGGVASEDGRAAEISADGMTLTGDNEGSLSGSLLRAVV
jgi:hypothetical protein